MTKKEQKFVTSWAKTRQIGMMKFMIFSGGLWGVLTASIIQMFALSEMSFKDAFFSSKFAVQLSIFIVIGIVIFGLVMWKINEKKYLRLVKEE